METKSQRKYLQNYINIKKIFSLTLGLHHILMSNNFRQYEIYVVFNAIYVQFSTYFVC